MASVVYPTQGVRERARVFETLNFFLKRPDVAVLCAFSGNTIACSCSMSATGAPRKALKVRPPEAKHYKLRHPCTLPNSLYPNATVVHIRVTLGHHRVTISHFRVTVGGLKNDEGHFRVTIGH